MDKVLVIAGDRSIADRVFELLAERGVAARLADPYAMGSTAESMFDATFDFGATAVVFIEPIARVNADDCSDLTELRKAARRAAQSPLVTGFGWVTTGQANEQVMDFQSLTKPYGVLRLSPVIDVGVDEELSAANDQCVLIRGDLAKAVDRNGAMLLEEAATRVIDWVEREAFRQGGRCSARGHNNAVERAVRAHGFEPLVLARWRVGLNGWLGMPFLDSESAPWTIRRKSLLRFGHRSQAQGLARAGTGASG